MQVRVRGPGEVWLAFDQDQLSRKARTAISNTRKNASGLAISNITLLEYLDAHFNGQPRLRDLHQRHVCYTAEHTTAGTTLRFVIPNESGGAAEFFSFCYDFGEMENRIEELHEPASVRWRTAPRHQQQ